MNILSRVEFDGEAESEVKFTFERQVFGAGFFARFTALLWAGFFAIITALF